MASSIQEYLINPITFFIFTFLLIHGFISPIPVTATSTIRPGDQLNSTTLPLISPSGKFTLGFFTIDATNYTYLGIWYTNDDQARKVWVANRDAPIITANNSGELYINNITGKLIITSRGRTIFSIPDQGWPGANLSATIQDSGNFVLVDENEPRVLWQSFDYPTNVLLPGMKLGYNLTNGKVWNLTSWLSDEFPAKGSFSMSWEPKEESKRLIIRLRGEPYWTSGNISIRNQSFEFIPGMDSWRYSYILSYVDNAEEKYFSIKGEEKHFSMEGDHRKLPMWILRTDGQFMDADNSAIWGSFENFCYGYETDYGCVDNSVLLPECRGRNDMFRFKRTVDFQSTVTNRFIDNSSISLGDCMDTCWKECDCVGFSTAGNGTSCQLWNGRNDQLPPNEQGNSGEKYVLSPRKPVKKSKKWIPIVIAAVVVSLATLSFGLLCYVKRKNRQGKEKELLELMTLDGYTETVLLETDGKKGQDLKFFGYSSIVLATNSFSAENKLGEGGFGPVYKGNLMDGREIAVKRLSRISGQGLVEFKNELILIAKLQHINLVRVLGCCMHRDEKMLIYEYMPNKSLDFFLFDQKNRSILDWPKRVKIIEGITQGLLYLHKYSRMRVIHRDLKASNILLDENMNPKISDFGMARIFKQNETEAMTNRVVGTYGYMSPEYAMEGTFSEKSDVFSFGVLILEIVSGRRNNSFYNLDRPLNLIGYAWELWREGGALELKDPTIGHSFAANQMLRTVHVALLCVQESAGDRPNMSQVISMLSNETLPLPYPNQPAFFTGRSVHEPGEENYSINYASITDTEPR